MPLGAWKGFRVAMKKGWEEEVVDVRISGRETGLEDNSTNSLKK